jgi:hypothetical protein
MNTEFENKMKQEGYSFNIDPEGYYKISPVKQISLPIKVQLVESKPINEIIHGSQNASAIDAIGFFRFKLDTEEKPDIIIFQFEHFRDGSSVYMIIPEETLRKRLEKNIIRSRSNEYFELRLWLMNDQLFDTTSMGLEAEWFYLSDGKGGRMIEPTIWNYTSFLNSWILDSWE